MSLLHHREPWVPFDGPTDEVAELRAERHKLCSLIEDQRVELARTERELHETRKRLAAAERALAGARRRWWQP